MFPLLPWKVKPVLYTSKNNNMVSNTITDLILNEVNTVPLQSSDKSRKSDELFCEMPTTCSPRKNSWDAGTMPIGRFERSHLRTRPCLPCRLRLKNCNSSLWPKSLGILQVSLCFSIAIAFSRQESTVFLLRIKL